MDLHRIEGAPEWAGVPAAKRNIWQRAAARTKGIATIGNFFSVLGFMSVPYGLLLVSLEHFVAAAIVLALGRLCDLADGWLADKTATKSPLGEKVDASFDKISTVAALIGLVVLGTVPVIIAVLLVAPHAAISVVALTAYVKGKAFHPSLVGKLSMAAIWATILVLIAMQAIDGDGENIARFIALGLLGLSTGLGVSALGGYIMELHRSVRDA